MTVDKYLSVLVAALNGDEEDVLTAVLPLRPKERARLLNAFDQVRLLIDRREAVERRNG